MTAGVGTSMLYSGITSTLAERRRNGFPRRGRKVGVALKSLPARVPPREKEPRKRSWFAPLSKERLSVNASIEDNPQTN
jgi:hypothetical protein